MTPQSILRCIQSHLVKWHQKMILVLECKDLLVQFMLSTMHNNIIYGSFYFQDW